jgi:GST-like protein
MNWLFWQMGSAPYLGGGFGHFYAYAPMKIQYAIDRFAMEVKRQLDVLDKHLANNEFMPATSTRLPTWRSGPGTAAGGGPAYDAGEFLRSTSYKNVSAGLTRSTSAPRSSAAAWSTRPSAIVGAAARAPRRQRLRVRRRRTSSGTGA